MRAALLACCFAFLSGLPLAAADLATPASNLEATDQRQGLPPIYLGTQANPGPLFEDQIPRLHRVWRSLTGRVQGGLEPQPPAMIPEEGIRDHLLQW